MGSRTAQGQDRMQGGMAAAGYRVRHAQSAGDLARVMALRAARFGVGQDVYDAEAVQIMIEKDDALLATFRLRGFANGAAMAGSYSAQFYDLADFARLAAPAVELGRLCLAPGLRSEADVLRLAFAAMAGEVDRLGAAMLFGCASFPGSDAAPHRASLSLLRRYVGYGYKIGKNAAHNVDLSQFSDNDGAELQALQGLPSLLRSYLAIGGWVGGHTVQDMELGTIHVFTAVEVAAIPPARARALRALAREMAPE